MGAIFLAVCLTVAGTIGLAMVVAIFGGGAPSPEWERRRTRKGGV